MIKFSTKMYDALKSAAQIWIPAAGTLYFTLSGIWGLPDATKVVGSITAFDLFLGVILGLSSAAYSVVGDGNLVVDKSDPTSLGIQLTTAPEVMASQKSITLVVKPKPTAVTVPPQT
jgi:hypothetical protein